MSQNVSKSTLLITVILMDLLSGMEFDLFVPSFPALQAHFGVSPSWLTALLSINFVGYCISLFFLGDLSDRYGRKPIILLGLITFVVGSMFCLWPFSYEVLLFGRLLQGLGIAAPAILSFLIIADAYPLKEQQFLMALLNGSMNLAVAIAPVVGSYVTLYFHWQGNFAVLLTMGTIILVMTFIFIPAHRRQENGEPVSLHGIQGYIALFQSKPLMLLMTNLLFIFVPYWIFVGMSPLLYIKDLGVSLKHFGYYQGALAFVFAIGSILYGLAIKHINHDDRKMLYFSMSIFIASFIAISLVTLLNSSNPLLITLAILIFVIGQIIPSVILYPICLNFIPHAKGRVSAIIQGARLILTAISLQIAGYYYQGTFRNVGIIMLSFIFIAIITLYFVIHHRELIETRHSPNF
jgi:MFS transporter, DHA1 family, multidrug resistance protein